MRILLLIVVCSLLGVVLGGFSSWKEFDGVKERFDPHNGDNVQEAQIADVAQKEGKALGATSGSRVKVDGELHDFGEISRGSKGAHLRGAGPEPSVSREELGGQSDLGGARHGLRA